VSQPCKGMGDDSSTRAVPPLCTHLTEIPALVEFNWLSVYSNKH